VNGFQGCKNNPALLPFAPGFQKAEILKRVPGGSHGLPVFGIEVDQPYLVLERFNLIEPVNLSRTAVSTGAIGLAAAAADEICNRYRLCRF
jgi:hypothetical protein